MNVYLAPLDSTDMGMIRAWRNDHRIWRFCRQFDLISDAEQVRWFNRQSEDPTIRMYKIMVQTITQAKDEEPKVVAYPAGVCGLTSIDHVNRRAEFSLYLAPELHGKGLGKIALQCLLLHGFTNFGLNVIWGEAFAINPAAKMFEKLGFKLEGTRRDFYFRDGRFIDAHLYSITAEEFYASRAGALGDAEPDLVRPVDLAADAEPCASGSEQSDQRGDSGAAREGGEAEADCA